MNAGSPPARLTPHRPEGSASEGRSMKRTCEPSRDQKGRTQQPPVVSWRAIGTGVGRGVMVCVGKAVGDGGAVAVAGALLTGLAVAAATTVKARVGTRVGKGAEQASSSPPAKKNSAQPCKSLSGAAIRR